MTSSQAPYIPSRPPLTGVGPAGRQPRRAEVAIRQVSVWSALKLSTALSVLMGLVGVGCSAVLFWVLVKLGVVASVNTLTTDLIRTAGAGHIDADLCR